MDEHLRDDAPNTFSLSRRKVIIGGSVLAVSLAVHQSPPLLAATSVNANNSPFMALSHLLIDHELNTEIGNRISIAMSALNPALNTEIDQLLSIAKQRDAKHVEDFFGDIPEGPVKATALAIISAWYIGVVVDGPGQPVYAYELALMYRPTIDVMTIPTYAISGPNGWNAIAQPIGNMPEF